MRRSVSACLRTWTMLGRPILCSPWYLVMGVVLRVYFGIVTKDWHNVIYQPIKDTMKLPSMIKYYTFLAKDHPFYGKYNPGQKGMYTGVLVLAIVQILTGFILYKPVYLYFLGLFLGRLPGRKDDPLHHDLDICNNGIGSCIPGCGGRNSGTDVHIHRQDPG